MAQSGRRTSRITNRISTVDDHLELDGITEPHFHTAVVIDFIENPLWYMRQKVGDLKWSMGAKKAANIGPNIADLNNPGNSSPDVSGLDNNWYKGFIDTSADINSIGSGVSHDEKTFSETLMSGNRFIRQLPGVDLISQVTRMPRNSILGVITSNQEAQRSQVFELLYPFFPQHFCLPAKAGEKIWVYFETTPDGDRGQGYWLCRKSSTLQVEDVNYTHLDRVSEIFGMVDSSSGKNINRPFSFPDGGIGTTYNNSLPGTDPYERILDASISYRNFTGEPVPAFSKRSSDLVLQGSNNTLISLGQDRPSVLSLPDAGAVPGIGTIDIVAGRGQATATAPTPVENKRPTSSEGNYSDMEYEEADKYTQSKDPSKANMAEGDPDFINDLSRIYVSMKTEGDTNFGITVGDQGATPLGDTNIDNSGQGPYTIMRSTNPRISARNDGSIKIVHDGGASIVMDKDGNIEIRGTSISLGKDGSTASEGGKSGMQPFVRAKDLEDILKNLISETSSAFATISTAFATNVTPGFGAPNPVLTANAGTVGSYSTSIAAIEATLSQFKSNVIKGE